MITLGRLRTLLPELLHRYKYVLLVIGAGLVMLLWPVSDAGQEHGDETANVHFDTRSSRQLEEDLEQILGQAEGVGRVVVRLSVSADENVIYAQESETQSDRSYADGFLADERMQEMRKTQVVNRDGDEEPIVISRQSPTYQGALVVCQGADRADVRLTVTRAVASMTGLGSDKIVVMKMKN